MTPQRRTALVSVLAASGLVVLKLVTGLATGSLGLVSEALHSGTDLVAALLTFFAVGVAVRPADSTHPYGHGKAEHLAALGEAAILVAASLVIVTRALSHLVGASGADVDATWYAFVVIGLVIAIDASRTFVSARAARRYASPALAASALHFVSDLAGSAAVLVGLLLVRTGYTNADSAAAVFVAALVLVAAARLIRRNVDVLMDRVPAEAEGAARTAIGQLGPSVQLRRLRMRQAAGKHFADVVIGISPGAGVGQAHAAADAVEKAVQRALPETDVVVHVEPRADEAALRERLHAAAVAVPQVREVHNVSAVATDQGVEVSLHLKLPADLSLEEAHGVASDVEGAIADAIPDVASVQTHIEPLSDEVASRATEATDVPDELATVTRIVRETTGSAPRQLRFVRTNEGLRAFLTLGLEGERSLAEAHARASEIEERVRRERPDIVDVIVHTEP
jgi:cation diffusion facilitator family transporter